MLVLTGGTGTVKLLRGFSINGTSFDAVVNTAEDTWISGNLVCPDIDSVIYGLSGILDKDFWGIQNDSYRTHEMLQSLGVDEYMKIGDLDRSIHIARTLILKEGKNLTEVVKTLSQRLGINETVIPMTHDKVETYIYTSSGKMHFQEFWVKEEGEPDVDSIEFNGINEAKPSPLFREKLRETENVLIGPSNPVTSIDPILRLKNVRKRLLEKNVAVISPIIEGKPVSGPVEKFLTAKGFESTSKGVKDFYGEITDLFITDKRSSFGKNKLDTLMKNKKEETRFAREITNLLTEKGWI